MKPGGCRAAITLYMSLVLLVFLSLLAAGFYSMQTAAGRVAVQAGAEEGLFSAFAGYDRLLFEKYGLLFLDIGRGSGNWQPGAVLERIEEDADKVICPSGGKTGLLDIRLCRNKTAVTGLVLATDLGGAAFARQICRQESLQSSEGDLYRLREKTQADASVCRELLAVRKGFTVQRAEEFYEEPEEIDGGSPGPGFRNPVQVVENLKKKGILSLVLPEAGRIPTGSVEGEALASMRSLKGGIGLCPKAWEGGSADADARVGRYLLENFCCFTDERPPAGLACQIEYAFAGCCTDRENLRKVFLELMKIREASNLFFLLTNPSKGREADRLAASMTAVMAVPETAPAVSFALKTAWAYAESLADLRRLVNGGKVPLKKDSASWQLELTALSYPGAVPAGGGGGDHGLDYRDYLQLLLRGRQKLLLPVMDLVEMNMRAAGQSGFALDCCVDAMEVEMHAEICGRDFRTRRCFGYDM